MALIEIHNFLPRPMVAQSRSGAVISPDVVDLANGWSVFCWIWCSFVQEKWLYTLVQLRDCVF